MTQPDLAKHVALLAAHAHTYRKALTALDEACRIVDADESLDERIDGSLLDAAAAALKLTPARAEREIAALHDLEQACRRDERLVVVQVLERLHKLRQEG